MILHNYFRSSTSVRVRVALRLKGLDYDYRAYHLLKDHVRNPQYLALNPQALVPALELNSGDVLTQSIAIIEYLDEVYPDPPLLPDDPLARTRMRAIALAIACDIHPVNNLRVLKQVRKLTGDDEQAVKAWFQRWVTETFAPLETMISASPDTGVFCYGNAPGLADICLFAQVVNNQRFDVDMRPYPTIRRIHSACLELEPFTASLPANQPDAE